MSKSETRKLTPLDEVFVYRLKTLHSILAPLVHDSLKNKLASDKVFKKRYEEWIAKQGWTSDEERQLNVANQAAYIVVNRILFYKALEKKKELPPLTKAENVSGLLKNLRLCFARALKIDYRAVFQRDSIYDEIPITPEMANVLNIIIDEVSEYNLADMKRDIIGLLYERLIPTDERHRLGQFYTPPKIVEPIVKMCVRNPDDKLLDPACGSGGFLVEAYNRLLALKGKSAVDDQTHQEVLRAIWGIDINKFPAQLATINLAKQNLESKSDMVNVIVSDFFNVRQPAQKVLAPWSALTPDGEKEIIEIPLFDVVVANPPYTRQEEIEEKTFGKEYKDQLFKTITDDFPGIKLSKRASIYTYFFIHATRFLRARGRLGFVTLRSWLDVGYGKEVQRFFLDNFKIKTIIESKTERWFADAQMLPCMSIFERCLEKSERENNFVKFVLLKVPISRFDASCEEKNFAQGVESAESPIDHLVYVIENAERLYDFAEISYLDKSLLLHENDLLRIVMVKQRYLREDSKWGKYLRAPSAFFKILEKAKDLLTPLENGGIAKVNFGIKTGANSFFYLPNKFFMLEEHGDHCILVSRGDAKRFLIEKKYLSPIIIKIRPHKRITITQGDGLCLMVHEPVEALLERKSRVIEYIRHGENMDIHERPTCGSRTPWYDLGGRNPSHIVSPTIFWNRHVIFLNESKALTNAALYEIRPVKEKLTKALCAILNSTITALFLEFSGRYMENRDRTVSNQIKVYEMQQLPVISPEKLDDKTLASLEDAFDRLRKREIHPISVEVDQEDRKNLDSILFDVLDLTEKDRMEVYEGIKELVAMRMKRTEEELSILTPEIELGEAMTPKELEEIVELLQLSKIGQITEEQKMVLGQRAGKIVRDIAYELIKLNNEVMHTKEITAKLLNIEDKILKLAGYFDVIKKVMGGKITPSQVTRDLLDIWRDKPEGIEKTIPKLLSADSRLLKIGPRLIGLSEWPPNQLFQIYVQLLSKYRTTDSEKKETFKEEAIRLLETGEVDFPDKEGLIQTLRRL